MAPRELRRLAEERGRRHELVPLESELLEVLVVLEHVVLEVVLLEDADAVQVALGQVLEGALPAEREQHLVAVEGALAEPARLEAVGRRLEQVHALHHGAPPGGLVAEPVAGAPQVESHEPLRIGLLPESSVLGETLPQNARPAVVPRLLELDRRVAEPSRLLVGARGLPGPAQLDRTARQVRGHVGRQLSRGADLTEEEVHRRRRPATPGLAERACKQTEVRGQLLVEQVGAIDERPKVGQRALGAALLEARHRP